MATFRVGDRARLVNCENAGNPAFRGCSGDEVAILALPGCNPIWPDEYEITRPASYTSYGGFFYAPAYHLAPLTDPGADAFLARLKKLGSEPVNDAPKVEVPR